MCQFKIVGFLLLVSLLAQGSENENQTAAAESHFLNIKTAPLGLLFGVYGLDLEFKIKDSWSFGPSVSTLTVSNTARKVFIYQAGIGPVFYLDSSYLEDGWALGVPVYFIHVVSQNKSSSNNKTSTANLLGIGAYLAYRWHFPHGINTDLGLGLSYFGSNSPENELRSLQPIIIWSIGWWI